MSLYDALADSAVHSELVAAYSPASTIGDRRPVLTSSKEQ